MTTPTDSSQSSRNTGKMIVQQPEAINILDLKPTDCNKVIEVKVYRKWIARNPKTPDPTSLCCILIDRQGNAIQANMAPKDIQFFNRKIQENIAYRISGFSCEEARKWQRTVEHITSLIFGHATDFDIIPHNDFPEYYFRFAAYNELGPRADNKNAILTDYIGCIQRINNTRTTGSATSSVIKRRVIDVQNLDGLTIKFTMWNEMATDFDIDKYETLEKPVIIAISSCRVTNRYNELQLSGTSATRYFLNPDILEAREIRELYDSVLDIAPVLTIEKQRFENEEQEKYRNRVSLKTLLEINPQTYRHVRFTNEAIILSIEPNRPWYYKRCSECTRKVIGDFPMARCIDHGPQPIPNYSYCFKAKIDDGTGQITLTCFSPESNEMVIECNNVLAQLEDKNTKQLPLSLTSLQGTQHIFQFHFSKESQLGHASFILDKVLDPKPLAILPPDTEISETSTLNIKTSKLTEDMTESTSKVSTPATEYQIVAPEKETETSNPGKKTAAKRQL